ncbi:MAG TPA: putative Ig domain-containing protein [Azospirillaceae bacterium]|nr:putative Ig domain-containing protein [Azospirillaceae bacterium]
MTVLILDLNGTSSSGNDAQTQFTEQTAILLFPNATITTGTTAGSGGAGTNRADMLTVTLPAGFAATESLSLSKAGQDALSDGKLTVANGVLTITKDNAQDSYWQTILRNVVYNDSSDSPANAGRTIVVTATDRDQNLSAKVMVQVTTVNDAPQLKTAIADQSTAEDAAWTFTVPSNAFTDPDGTTPTYSRTVVDAQGTALASQPSWLDFDAATRTFSGTPPQDFNGELFVKVTASDGASSASDIFKLTVTPVNDAPVLAAPVPDQSSPEDEPVSFVLPAGTFKDVDHATLAYAATVKDGKGDPVTWLSFDKDTRSFTGTPPQEYSGVLTVEVTATDGEGASASDSFKLTVTPVNDAPVVAEAIKDQSSPEDSAWTFTFPAGTFTDVDDATLAYDFDVVDGKGNPLADQPSWLGFDAGTRTFGGTPPQDFNGTLAVRVTASDGETSAADTFVLTVTPVNDAPVLAASIADQSTKQGAAWSFGLPAGTFKDVDGDTLTYAYTAVDGGGKALAVQPSWLTLDAASGAFSGTPPQSFTGDLDIRVTASDGELSATDIFRLTVVPVNRPPVAVNDSFGASTKIYEETEFLIDIADLMADDSDPDGDPLQFVSAGTPSKGTLTTLVEGGSTFLVYRYTATGLGENATASDSFTYTIGDGRGGTATGTVALTVTGLANKVLTGGNGAETLTGSAIAHDVISGLNGDDTLLGLAGNDKLLGGNGVDRLRGGDGNDVLDGGRGDDWLDGGRGTDTMSGGLGADIFEIGLLVEGVSVNTGIDRITDFQRGTDRIRLMDGVQVTAINANANLDNDGIADTVLSLNNGGVVQLLGVSGVGNPDTYLG